MRLPVVKRFGDKALLIELVPQISAGAHGFTLALLDFVQLQQNLGIIETTSTYYSVAIYFSEASTIEKTINLINKWLATNRFVDATLSKRIIEIPVCYDLSFGLDLEEISQKLQLSIRDIVRKHTAPLYTVHFIGFLPGFPYLEGLDTDLSLSRKRSPRQNLAAGSVAIGGNQTGVYPSDSPGGWNILGKTPISMFDIKNKNPSLLKPGDQLRFKSISLATYLKIDSQIVNNSFKLISV